LSFFLILALGFIPACARSSHPDLERVLKASWESYRRDYLSPEGRVILAERDEGSISEAQAYALLRAVWSGDQATFDRVYAWTRAHLSRASRFGDHLLAWHWGKTREGAWLVLDWHSASDADLDYALALTLAHRRGWRPPASLPPYLDEARAVARDILAREVVECDLGRWGEGPKAHLQSPPKPSPPTLHRALGGELDRKNGEHPQGAGPYSLKTENRKPKTENHLLLTPGNWHEDRPPYLVNPSYFSPGTYRLLDQVAPDPRWERLRASTYVLLDRFCRGLGDKKGVGLIPDWCRVAAGGRAEPAPDRDTDFGWEAVRLPWRLALDARWFKDEGAARLMAGHFLGFFQNEWQAKSRLAAVYSYDGKPLVNYESPVMYAGALGAALAAGDRDFAGQLARKILSCYHQDQSGRAYFATPDNYYANNWAWFGLALYAGWVQP
jgi:endo-1,4-beta-D-glucanase Y